jgi:hypothetical protein
MLFNKIDPKSAPAKGAETDSQAKSGKEIIAEAYKSPKWVPHYSAQADSGRA